MYFNYENVAITPCGGIIHFQLEFNNQRTSPNADYISEQLIHQLKFSLRNLSNGEKITFTNESSACKGTEFWFKTKYTRLVTCYSFMKLFVNKCFLNLWRFTVLYFCFISVWWEKKYSLGERSIDDGFTSSVLFLEPFFFFNKISK